MDVVKQFHFEETTKNLYKSTFSDFMDMIRRFISIKYIA